MTSSRGPRIHERWAHLRFSVVGQLLAAPPAKGELRAAIASLAARQWCPLRPLGFHRFARHHARSPIHQSH